MAEASKSLGAVQFGPFELLLDTQELRKHGLPVKLSGQAIQILIVLATRPSQLVTREELQRKLWPTDSYGDFEHGLNAAINKLREKLGDSATTPTYVETLPGRGYRFIGEIRPEAGAQGIEPKPPKWRGKWKVALIALALVVAGTALLYTRRRPIIDITQLGVRERRLTANPEDTPVTSAVISPDGKYLAYTDRTGFYLRQVSSGETNPIPLPRGFEPVADSWFPDSLHMAVSWIEQPNHEPSIWQISVLGGTPRKLIDDGSSARVSPDGSKIAFMRGKSYSGELWVMQADGSEMRKVAGGTQAEIEDGFSPAAWSPDGLRIAYVRTTPQVHKEDETKIEIADVTSNHIQVALSSAGLAPALAWTHDNRLIYSVQEPSPNDADFNLWSVQLDARTAKPLGQGSRITHGQGGTAELSITIDGKLLALRRLMVNPDVYFDELTDDGKKMGTPERLTLDDRVDYPMAWTPDNKTVLSDYQHPPHFRNRSTHHHATS